MLGKISFLSTEVVKKRINLPSLIIILYSMQNLALGEGGGGLVNTDW